MNCRMTLHEGVPSLPINDYVNDVACSQAGRFNLMGNALFSFFDVDNVVGFSLVRDGAGVMGLASADGVENGLIEDDELVLIARNGGDYCLGFFEVAIMEIESVRYGS